MVWALTFSAPSRPATGLIFLSLALISNGRNGVLAFSPSSQQQQQNQHRSSTIMPLSMTFGGSQPADMVSFTDTAKMGTRLNGTPPNSSDRRTKNADGNKSMTSQQQQQQRQQPKPPTSIPFYTTSAADNIKIATENRKPPSSATPQKTFASKTTTAADISQQQRQGTGSYTNRGNNNPNRNRNSVAGGNLMASQGPISKSYQRYERSLNQAYQQPLSQRYQTTSNNNGRQVASAGTRAVPSNKQEYMESTTSATRVGQNRNRSDVANSSTRKAQDVSKKNNGGVLNSIKGTAQSVQETAENVQTTIEDVQTKAQNVQTAINNAQSKARNAFDYFINGGPEIPLQFAVDMNWPYILSPALGQPAVPMEGELNRKNMPLMLAFRCLNARGSIAHGKAITQYFKWDDVNDMMRQNKYYVRNVFDRYGGGAKELRSIDEIKRELVLNGPVISISFQLTKEYYNMRLRQSDISMDAFLPQKEGSHELLIVGWELGDNGENWLVQSVGRRNPLATIPIGFTQFDIETLCLAPRKRRLDHLSWQPGPYLDIDIQRLRKQIRTMGVADWREADQLDLKLSYGELEAFLEQVGGKKAVSEVAGEIQKWNSKDSKDIDKTVSLIGMAGYGNNNGDYPERFLLRDESKYAHSQYFTLCDIRYDNDAMINKWIISVDRYPYE